MPKADSVGWPSALVAGVLLAVVAAITIAAIVQYDVEDALKIWNGLTGLVGVVTGAFVSYFFTRSTVQQAQQHAQRLEQQAQTAQANVSDAQRALGLIAGHLEPAKFQTLMSTPEIRKVFSAREPVE